MRGSSPVIGVLAAAGVWGLALATKCEAAVLSTSAVTLRAVDTYIACHATNVGNKPIEVEVAEVDNAGNAASVGPFLVNPGETQTVSFQPLLKPNPFRCRFTFQGGKSKLRGSVENAESGATSEAR